MTGAIVLNKPEGMTSRDLVNKLNRILETKEIGHIGTLDPMATGVMVCLIGRATKLTNLLVNHDKEYLATFKLGILTDTLDRTGNILKEEKFNLDEEKLIKVLNSFIGSYEQEVPIYSSVKVDGKKLYEYARREEKVILPKKEVTIYSLELLDIKDSEITIKTKVSKGTYIRSLIRDIGEALNTYGTLTALERTLVGNFKIENACTIDEVLNNNYHLYSICELLKDYPKEEVDPEMLYKIRNGQILERQIDDYLLFTSNGKEIALYEKYGKDEAKIKPSVMFYIF